MEHLKGSRRSLSKLFSHILSYFFELATGESMHGTTRYGISHSKTFDNSKRKSIDYYYPLHCKDNTISYNWN